MTGAPERKRPIEWPRPKFVESVHSLTFLDRLAYVRGITDLTTGLRHTMSDEWTRADEWRDFAGVAYASTSVWEYANGPACVAECTPGLRDVGNVGMGPEDFQELVFTVFGRRLYKD